MKLNFRLRDLQHAKHFSNVATCISGDVETSLPDLAARLGATKVADLLVFEDLRIPRYLAGVITNQCFVAYSSRYGNCNLELGKHARTTVKAYALGKVSAEILEAAHGEVLSVTKIAIANTAKSKSKIFNNDPPLLTFRDVADPAIFAAEEALQTLLAATEKDDTFDLNKVLHHARLTFPGPEPTPWSDETARDMQLGVVIRYALLTCAQEAAFNA